MTTELCQREGDNAQGGNTYHCMYGDHIEGGKCSCGSGAQENMHPMFTECGYTRAVRDKAMGQLGRMWVARTGGRVRLLEIQGLATMVGVGGPCAERGAEQGGPRGGEAGPGLRVNPSGPLRPGV